MENAAKLIAVTFLSLFLVACGNSDKPQAKSTAKAAGLTINKAIHVSDGDSTLNNQPAVTLYAGATDENYFEVTLYRSNVKAGYSATSSSASNPELSVSATWDGANYVQSSKHATEAALKITSITPTEAVAELSAKLVNPSSGKFLELQNSVVKVDGELLKRLTAN